MSHSKAFESRFDVFGFDDNVDGNTVLINIYDEDGNPLNPVTITVQGSPGDRADFFLGSMLEKCLSALRNADRYTIAYELRIVRAFYCFGPNLFVRSGSLFYVNVFLRSPNVLMVSCTES